MKKHKLSDSFWFIMLRHHWQYVVALLVFMLMFVVILPLQINGYLDAQVELDTVQNDILRLENEKKKIQSYSDSSLDSQLEVVTSVFPNESDKFALFNNIALLQERYGILIQNFSSPFSSSDEDELIGINVQALAPKAGFKKLIGDYFYATGKLTTIDRIFYDTDSSDMSFTIFFHSKKMSVGEGVVFAYDDAAREQIQEIGRQLQALKNSSSNSTTTFTGDVDPNYDPKSNPFSN